MIPTNSELRKGFQLQRASNLQPPAGRYHHIDVGKLLYRMIKCRVVKVA